MAYDLFNVVYAGDQRASSAGNCRTHLGMGLWARRVPGGLAERPRSDVAGNVGKNVIGIVNALASSCLDSRNI